MALAWMSVALYMFLEKKKLFRCLLIHCHIWVLLGLTHLSSTPVLHRGRSWPHQEGPLPRWDTKPKLHSQSSSRREDTGHNIAYQCSKQTGGYLANTFQEHIKPLLIWDTGLSMLVFSYIPGVFQVKLILLLLANDDPVNQWKLIPPWGNLTVVTEEGDLVTSFHVFPSDPGIPTKTRALYMSMCSYSFKESWWI